MSDWSTDAVTLNHPVLVADIETHYASLDYVALFATVLDHRQVDMHVAIAALEDVLSEIAVPYVDEDDAS